MEYIFVGTIVGTHGIKGELKVKTDSSFIDERFKKGNILYITESYKPITITSHRTHKTLELITINDLYDINKVESMVGSKLYIKTTELPKLSKDEYYYHDLIGKTAYDKDTIIGKVIDCFEVPQGTMLRIEKQDKKTVLVPFLKQFIEDVTDDKIYIKVIEGLV